MENVITNWMMTPYQFELSSIARPNTGYIPCENCGGFRWVRFGHKTRFCSAQCYGDWRTGKYSGANSPNYKNAMIEFECKQCGGTFYANRCSNRMFCTRRCHGDWMSDNLTGSNNSFYGMHHSIDTKQSISESQTGDKNYWRTSGKVNSAAICAMNDKRTGVKLSEDERIRISCTLRNILPEDFDGFVSNERKKFMESGEYKRWRDSIFERDDYTCQECFKRGGNLNVHHILPYKDYPDEYFTLNYLNGITLCRKCHEKTFCSEHDYVTKYQSVLGVSYIDGALVPIDKVVSCCNTMRGDT